LFVDTIKFYRSSRGQYFTCILLVWYCDETTVVLIVFLKVGQVSESSEQCCLVGLFRPNFKNLASFQVGWRKKF